MGVGETGQIIGETGVGEMGVIRESMVKLIIQEANARLKFLFRKLAFKEAFSYVSYSMSLRLCLFILVPRLVARQLLRNRLQVTQNKMIRFVLKLDPWAHQVSL